MTPRKRLTEEAVAMLEADFEANGVGAIETLRRLNPSAYINVIAAVIPQQITVNSVELTDDELDARIAELACLLALGE